MLSKSDIFKPLRGGTYLLMAIEGWRNHESDIRWPWLSLGKRTVVEGVPA